MSCRSRSSASVGFWPTGWNGARKIPNRSLPSASMVVMGLRLCRWRVAGGRLVGDQDLAVPARRAQRLERAGRAGQVDGRRDQELGTGDPVGQAPEGGGELVGGVAEREAKLHLLGDRHERLDGVGLHADTHDHDAAVRWRIGEERLEHARDADGLEDDGVGHGAAERGDPDALHDRPRDAERGPAIVRRRLGRVDDLVGPEGLGEAAPRRREVGRQDRAMAARSSARRSRRGRPARSPPRGRVGPRAAAPGRPHARRPRAARSARPGRWRACRAPAGTAAPGAPCARPARPDTRWSSRSARSRRARR